MARFPTLAVPAALPPQRERSTSTQPERASGAAIPPGAGAVRAASLRRVVPQIRSTQVGSRRLVSGAAGGPGRPALRP